MENNSSPLIGGWPIMECRAASIFSLSRILRQFPGLCTVETCFSKNAFKDLTVQMFKCQRANTTKGLLTVQSSFTPPLNVSVSKSDISHLLPVLLSSSTSQQYTVKLVLSFKIQVWYSWCLVLGC